MNLELIPPTRAQLLEILGDLDDGLRLEVDAFHGRGWSPGGEAERLAWAIEHGVLAHVLRDEAGRPAIAFGLTFVRPGVYQTWFTARRGWQAINPALVEIHAAIARKLFLPEHQVHRVQVWSLAGRGPHVRRWFERLGYTHEAVLARAGAQREDLDVYSMFPKGA